MSDTRRPLESLVVKEEVLAEEELAAALEPYLRFTPSGELLFDKRFDQLSTLDRTKCVLLAGRALHALGMRETAAMKNREIIRLTGMPEGTVASNLKKLKEEQRVAARTDDGWEIAFHALRRVVEALTPQEVPK